MPGQSKMIIRLVSALWSNKIDGALSSKDDHIPEKSNTGGYGGVYTSFKGKKYQYGNQISEFSVINSSDLPNNQLANRLISALWSNKKGTGNTNECILDDKLFEQEIPYKPVETLELYPGYGKEGGTCKCPDGSTNPAAFLRDDSSTNGKCKDLGCEGGDYDPNECKEDAQIDTNVTSIFNILNFSGYPDGCSCQCMDGALFEVVDTSPKKDCFKIVETENMSDAEKYKTDAPTCLNGVISTYKGTNAPTSYRNKVVCGLQTNSPKYAGKKIKCGEPLENCALIKKSLYEKDVVIVTNNTNSTDLSEEGGGSCKCPSGEIYQVSLQKNKTCDDSEQLACQNGTVHDCTIAKPGPWAYRKVVCGAKIATTKPDPVTEAGDTCYQPERANPFKIDNCLSHLNGRRGGGCFQCDNSRGYVLSKPNPEDGVFGVLSTCKLIADDQKAKLQNCWVLKDGDDKKCAMCLPKYVAAEDNSACYDPINSYVTQKIPSDKKKAEYYLTQGENMILDSPTDLTTNLNAYENARKAHILNVARQVNLKSIENLFKKSKLQLKDFRPQTIVIELGYHPGSLDQEKVYMEFVYIKKGSHIMGSISKPNLIDEFSAWNFPGIPVEITEGFYFMKYMITREQWSVFVFETNYRTDAENEKFLEGPWPGLENGTGLENGKTYKGAHCNWANPCLPLQQGNNEPVTSISYNDLKKFVEWINKKSKLQVRLPSVTEWEYVAKGGKTTPWTNGADTAEKADKLMWNKHNTDQSGLGADLKTSIYRTMDIGTKDSNDFGISDMHGNAYEWMEDSYDGRRHNQLKIGFIQKEGDGSLRTNLAMEMTKVWSNCKSYSGQICQCYPDWKQPIAQNVNCSKERTQWPKHVNCLKVNSEIPGECQYCKNGYEKSLDNICMKKAPISGCFVQAAVYSVINNFLFF